MKRVIASLVLAFSVVTLVGCGGDAKPSKSTKTETKAPTDTKGTDAKGAKK